MVFQGSGCQSTGRPGVDMEQRADIRSSPHQSIPALLHFFGAYKTDHHVQRLCRIVVQCVVDSPLSYSVVY